ncbi:MAG: ABC transporter ATP-binding protein [Gemmatimonadetes bacterium]|nr:ABC transporter ATP-binding protein [Gemmatimonadota bacterium]
MTTGGLVVGGLEIGFGDAPGLRAISFSVARAERVAVVGASGSGKTTLLRAVAGLVPIHRGTVVVGSRDVTRLPPELRGAVYLHQSPVLFPHLTVGENVAFALRLRRVPERETLKRVQELLTAVGLPDFAPRAPRSLSGGQRHRVALARAVAAAPEVLLLDEPLSALDPTLRDEVRVALLGLQAEYSPALLLVTHDLDEAALMADRIAVLLNGTLAQVAPPAELFQRPDSLAVARFLGMRNEIPGRVRSGRFECALGSFPVPAGISAAGELVGIIPVDAVDVVPSPSGSARVLGVIHRVQGTSVLVSRNGVELEARAAASSTPKAGETVDLRIYPERLILLPAIA